MSTLYRNGRDLVGQPLDLCVENGRFVERNTAARTVDLGAQLVLPGFVDAHCHIIPMGLDLQKLHLGPCVTQAEVLDAVRDWHRERPDGWLQAVHYDQTKFEDSMHLHRSDLDAVVPDRPVLLRHSNGHASLANSAALAAANISEDVADPVGGTFVRGSDGRLSGVLLERAHEFVTNAAPVPTLEDMVAAVLLASEEMSKLGVTCASDMMTGRWNLEQELLAYNIASKRGCKVRLRMYAQWGRVYGRRSSEKGRVKDLCSDMDPERCRLAGIKIFADGAISSGTAAIHGEYKSGGSGQLIYQPDKFLKMVRTADADGWVLAVHSIGDRSTDLVLDAFGQTQDPGRHRIEHAMILSDEQIARIAALGCRVTMQPEFLLRFGHSYRKQLPPETSSRLMRFRSVLEAGVDLSFSSDRPIVPGNPWDGIRAAVTRPDGFDNAENVAQETALELYTSASARANDDDDLMGTLAPGAVADFQVYRETPPKGSPQVFLG